MSSASHLRPVTTRANPDGAGSIRDPFPSNTIPAARFDKLGKNLVGPVSGPEPVRAGINYFNNPLGLDARAQRHGARRHPYQRPRHGLRAMVARSGGVQRPAAAAASARRPE